MKLRDYLPRANARVDFLMYLYAGCSTTFRGIQQGIEAQDAPYEWPENHEAFESPFLDEWCRAEDALDVLRESVASQLAETLKLFLQCWEAELIDGFGVEALDAAGAGRPSNKRHRTSFKKGWINGYRSYCLLLGIDWRDSSVDLDLLEQLVRTRNAVRHPQDIFSIRATVPLGDLANNARRCFADARDVALNQGLREHSIFLRVPRVKVSHEELYSAAEEIRKLCQWLYAQHPLHSAYRPVR